MTEFKQESGSRASAGAGVKTAPRETATTKVGPSLEKFALTYKKKPSCSLTQRCLHVRSV